MNENENSNFTYTLYFLFVLLEQTHKKDHSGMFLNPIEFYTKETWKHVFSFHFDYRNFDSVFALGENVVQWIDLTPPNYCQQNLCFFFQKILVAPICEWYLKKWQIIYFEEVYEFWIHLAA